MNILLFGPPGIGKSTLVEHFNSSSFKPVMKQYHAAAYDLENVRVPQGSTLTDLRYAEMVVLNKLMQQQTMAKGVNLVVGAAALDPKVDYPGFKKVFLTMPQAEYEARRAERDARLQSKASQKAHLIVDWMKGVHYDLIMDVSHHVLFTEQDMQIYAQCRWLLKQL